MDEDIWIDAVAPFTSRTIAHPFDSVAKRIAAGEYGFIQRIYEAVRAQMR